MRLPEISGFAIDRVTMVRNGRIKRCKEIALLHEKVDVGWNKRLPNNKVER